MMRKFCFILSILLCNVCLMAQDQVLRAKKDSESKKYGYENVGEKKYWWAEAHKLGKNKEELNADQKIEWVIAPQYDKVSKEFSEGLAAVEIDGKVGFIDMHNRFVIEPQFEPMDDMEGFHYGMAVVKKDGKYGFIDKRGIFVFRPGFDKAENFDDDLMAVIKMGKKFGCIDLCGDTVVPCNYLAKEIMKTVPIKNKPFKEAKKAVKAKWLSGYYNEFMESVVASEEYAARQMSNPNFQPVSKNAPTVTEGTLKALSGGYYLWQSGKNVGVIDSYGRQILAPVHASISYQPKEHIFVVQEAENFAGKPAVGLYNRAGGCIIPGVFESVSNFKNGVATATVGDYSTKVDVHGVVETEFIEKMLKASAEENGTYFTERLIGIWPTCAAAHNNFGIYYATTKDDLKHAINHFTVAHRLEPDNEDFKTNMKAAKSERNDRRWKRVLTGLQIAGTVLTLGAMTYSAVSGNTAMSSSSFSSGSSFSDEADYSSAASSTHSSASHAAGGKNDKGISMSKANSIRTYRQSYDRYESMVVDCNVNPEKHKPGDKREYQSKMREIRRKLENMGVEHVYHSPHEDN